MGQNGVKQKRKTRDRTGMVCAPPTRISGADRATANGATTNRAPAGFRKTIRLEKNYSCLPKTGLCT
ncbi:MAG: hypothetical protein Q4A82_05720, partial [Corynebacterium sp.]|nr:hypothetical protein [Corynebacterium sp.]